jgi:hypothetical protein
MVLSAFTVQLMPQQGFIAKRLAVATNSRGALKNRSDFLMPAQNASQISAENAQDDGITPIS